MPELDSYTKTYRELQKWVRSHSFEHNGRRVICISRVVTGYRDSGDPDSGTQGAHKKHERPALCLPGCRSSEKHAILAGSTTYPGEARHELQPCCRSEAVLQQRLWRHVCAPAAAPANWFEADVEQRGKCVLLKLTHVDSRECSCYLVERREFGLVSGAWLVVPACGERVAARAEGGWPGHCLCTQQWCPLNPNRGGSAFCTVCAEPLAHVPEAGGLGEWVGGPFPAQAVFLPCSSCIQSWGWCGQHLFLLH